MPDASDRRVVVLVEDDASLCQAMARVLRVAGLDPVVFASAEALLEAATTEGAICLVIDLHLPGMSGFALRDQLAGAGSLPPVIFITAFDEPEARALAAKAGAAAFLAKPFSGRALIDTIQQAAA